MYCTYLVEVRFLPHHLDAGERECYGSYTLRREGGVKCPRLCGDRFCPKENTVKIWAVRLGLTPFVDSCYFQRPERKTS